MPVRTRVGIVSGTARLGRGNSPQFTRCSTPIGRVVRWQLRPPRRMPAMRTTALLTLALLAASACSPPLFARSRVQLAVIDRDSGQWLPEYRQRGDTWIPGTPGHRYAVRLTNTSSERMLVVLSVDGVNAVSGETADLNQAGYVLSPGQSTDINGWRKSLDDVAQFVFTDFPDSYAARTGRPDNVGVIGIAVFEEARPPVTTRRSRRRTACRPKPSASPKRR